MNVRPTVHWQHRAAVQLAALAALVAAASSACMHWTMALAPLAQHFDWKFWLCQPPVLFCWLAVLRSANKSAEWFQVTFSASFLLTMQWSVRPGAVTMIDFDEDDSNRWQSPSFFRTASRPWHLPSTSWFWSLCLHNNDFMIKNCENSEEKPRKSPEIEIAYIDIIYIYIHTHIYPPRSTSLIFLLYLQSKIHIL